MRLTVFLMIHMLIYVYPILLANHNPSLYTWDLTNALTGERITTWTNPYALLEVNLCKFFPRRRAAQLGYHISGGLGDRSSLGQRPDEDYCGELLDPHL